ncbi:MAG TPA: ABC transporter permease [Vicinamibacterales bacterium]|nr:ABC transporter permease [Vicinamibacterales bacterium]
MSAHSTAVPVTYIRPGTRAMSSTVDEVWQARELLYFLVWRDIKVRYKQTALGVAWSVLQPFLTMVVFTIFFGRLARVPSDGVPYPLFSLAALVPWTYFSTAVSNGSSSLVGNQHLIAKVYFPRVLVPLNAVSMPVVDLAVSFGMLVILMAWYHVVPTFALLLLPLYVALAVVSAFAVTLWTSALTVRYRDARYVLPFLVQTWLFITPVAYPTSMVPERWRLLYALNPMATVVDGFRSSLLGTPASGAMAAVAVGTVIAALAAGIAYFRSVEGSIVDLA